MRIESLLRHRSAPIFRLAAPVIALCLFAFSGCKDGVGDPKPEQEIIQDVTGTVRWRVDIDSTLYVVVPDFNPDTAFALTGALLPPDNLPDEYKGEGVRVYFCGEVVEIPPNIELPMPPLRLTCIIKTSTVIRRARGTIREINRGPSVTICAVVADFEPIITSAFALTGLPEYMPENNLPDEFKHEGLRVLFSGEILPLPPNVDLVARPLILTHIQKL